MSKNMIKKPRAAVECFAGLYEKTEQKLSLTGYSYSTISNYLRELARISLESGTIPDNLAEEQINSTCWVSLMMMPGIPLKKQKMVLNFWLDTPVKWPSQITGWYQLMIARIARLTAR